MNIAAEPPPTLGDGGAELDVSVALSRIRAWGEARDWCGWDPYDALNSPAAGLLSLGTSIGRRLLVQAVKRSPVNLRPVLGVRPAWNQKAIGLVASAYAHLAATGDPTAEAAARRWCEWLVTEQVGGADGFAWGYHFEVQTRFFAYPARSPNTIATTFVGQALVDAVEQLGETRWIEPAVKTAEYLVAQMLVEGAKGPYFRYIPGDDKLIHNCNLLACAMLMRAGRLAGRGDLRDIAAGAVQSSLQAQLPDGSFPYSDWSGQGWVDNFHTGYVLESLATCLPVAGVPAALERGVGYWARELFLEDGTPKYFPDRVGPRDGHCYAQAIDTWLSLYEVGLPGLAEAERLASLLAWNMLTPDGAVIFQRHRWVTSRVEFVRWTTAPAFRALARLARLRQAGAG